MSNQNRTASEIIDSIAPDLPVGRASELIDADRMRAEGERQERERQQVADQANAGGGPRLR